MHVTTLKPIGNPQTGWKLWVCRLSRFCQLGNTAQLTLLSCSARLGTRKGTGRKVAFRMCALRFSSTSSKTTPKTLT